MEACMIFMNDRLTIPGGLKCDILQQIHEGRQGIEKCKPRDIESIVQGCAICHKFQHQNTKEPLLSYLMAWTF